MKVFTTLICVLILAICVACQNEQQRSDVVGDEVPPEGDVSGGDSPRLHVLLIVSKYVGHQIPLIAVGEELVGRGHNVSLLTTEVKGSRVVPQLVERVGINFISAGPDSRTAEVCIKYSRLLYCRSNQFSMCGNGNQTYYAESLKVKYLTDKVWFCIEN